MRVQMFAGLHDPHTSSPSYMQASHHDNAANLHQLATFISCAEQAEHVQVRHMTLA